MTKILVQVKQTEIDKVVNYKKVPNIVKIVILATVDLNFSRFDSVRQYVTNKYGAWTLLDNPAHLRYPHARSNFWRKRKAAAAQIGEVQLPRPVAEIVDKYKECIAKVCTVRFSKSLLSIKKPSL